MKIILTITSFISQEIDTYLILLLFIILIVIIGFLYFKLKEKNKYIQLFHEKLKIRDPEIKKEELSDILSKLKIVELKKIITKDKFFDENILNYIFKNSSDKKVFLHYTQDKPVALKICEEGFQFRYSFYKTAYLITQDKLDLIYTHSRSKYFGKNVIIISISSKIYDHYSKELKRISPPETFVEQILTEAPPFHDENNDVVYVLSNKFVKGYFNYETGKIISNPEFKPDYDCENFKKNLTRLENAYSKNK